MRIYVASSWRNEKYPIVVEALRAAGHEVYDFRNPHLPGTHGTAFHWSKIDPNWQSWTPDQFRDALKHPLAVKGLASDRAGLEWADACVCVMPCGRSAHLELGYMLGAVRIGIILIDASEPELMYGLADHLCVTIVEVIQKLAEGKPNRRR